MLFTIKMTHGQITDIYKLCRAQRLSQFLSIINLNYVIIIEKTSLHYIKKF